MTLIFLQSAWIDTSNESPIPIPIPIPIENNDFMNNIFDLSLYEINSVCNEFGKIFDLVFVSDVNKCTVVRSEPVTSPEDHYHPTLKIIIDISSAHTPANKHITNQNKSYCFPRTNYTELNGILSNVNWDSILAINNIDNMVSNFYAILHNSISVTLIVNRELNYAAIKVHHRIVGT